MSSSQPPKLNYAKARQKSKAKNEPQSQQKISFQAESSTDIFAHLNQDNLNYIKKELKNKKSHKDQKPKSIQETKNQLTKPRSQVEVQKNNNFKQKQQIYKNQSEISERDSHEQQTHRETQVDDSIMSTNKSSDYKGDIFKPAKISTDVKQKQKQKEIQFKEHQKSRYHGLEPPLLAYNAQKQGLVSSQSQHMNQLTLSLEIQKRGGRKQSANLHHKNPFHEYELKSEASNNPANSTVSVQNHLSQDLSANFRPSQFIDRLQNYIEELKFTPEKQKQSKIASDYSPASSLQKSMANEKKFMKDKEKRHENYGSTINGKGIMMSQRSDTSRPFCADELLRERQKIHQHGQYEGNFQKSNNFNLIRNYKGENQNENHQSLKNDVQIYEDLQRELTKQKSYGIKLALELEKYKQNEVKYERQVAFLHKSIENLKLQIINLKSAQDQQIEETKKILAYIAMQNQSFQSKKKNDQSEHKPDKLDPIDNLPFAYQYSSFKHPNTKQKKYWSEKENQFENFMKFSKFEPPYADLNPDMFEKLNRQFKKGQKSYHTNGSRNPLSDLKIPFDFAKYDKNSKNLYNHHNSIDQDPEFIDQILNLKEYRKEFSPKRMNGLRKTKQRDESFTERSSPSKVDRRVSAKNSLEKLKEEYELFRAKARLSRQQQIINEEW